MGKTMNLSNLQPAQERTDRKRVGRGPGSGKGKYSGRGIKGQKSRAGSHKMRPGFEGGQMPIYMRMGKQRGSTSKDAMPIGPFRTSTVPVNVRDLDRFNDGAVVTPESLVEHKLIKNTKVDVKILGSGEITKKLTVRVHAISEAARGKIERAGGKVDLLRTPKPKKVKHAKPKPTTPDDEEGAVVEAEADAAAESDEAPAESGEEEGAET